jgi:competence protein ComEC
VRYVSEALEHHVNFMEQARELVARLVRGVLDERRGGELLLSMAFGYRDVLSMPVEEAFTALGLKHLLVVSGYQVSLVFGVWYVIGLWLMRLTRLAYSVRAIVTLLALLVSAGFVVFIGVELSALRALVAAACVCATQVFERAGGFAQRWGVALLIVELLSPWAVFDMGVQLTFAALAGIGIGSRLARGGLGMSFVWVTTCVWLLTSLVVLVWNGSLSLVALPLNLMIAAPWSFLNCVVGGCGVILLMGSERLGAPVVQLVAWVNEVLANALLDLADSPLRAVVLEGWLRWSVCAAFVACAVAVSVRAGHYGPLVSSGHR